MQNCPRVLESNLATVPDYRYVLSSQVCQRLLGTFLSVRSCARSDHRKDVAKRYPFAAHPTALRGPSDGMMAPGTLIVNCTSTTSVNSTALPICIGPAYLAIAAVTLSVLLLGVIASSLSLLLFLPRRAVKPPAMRFVHALITALIASTSLALIAKDDQAPEVYWTNATPLLAIHCATWTLCCVLVLCEARVGHRAGLALRLWWLFAALVAIPVLPREVANHAHDLSSSPCAMLRLSGAVLTLLLGVLALCEPATPCDDEQLAPKLERGSSTSRFGDSARQRLLPGAIGSISDAPIVPSEDDTAPPPASGEARASILSSLYFGWCLSVLKTGLRRPLMHTDLFELMPTDRSAYHGQRLATAWRRQPNGKGVFLRAYHDTFGLWWWVNGLLEFAKDGLTLLQPPLTKLIIDYLNTRGSDMPFASAMCCAIAYFLIALAQSFLQTQFNWRAQRLVVWTQASVGDVVYRHALSLAHAERQRFGIGPIVSYMQVDAQKLAMAAAFWGHDVWSIPLVIIVGSVQLYSFLGWSALIGVGSMILVLPAQRYCQKNLMKYNQSLMKKRDERVNFTNEVLQGIKALKLYAWEPLLAQQLEARRSEEPSNPFPSR